MNSKTEITSKTTLDGVKSKPVTTGRQVSALLLNNGSAKIQEIIQTLNMHDKDKRFQLSIEVGSITLTYSMIIESGAISATEHPDLVVDVLFVEGW